MASFFGGLFSFRSLNDVEKSLVSAFSKIKAEFEEHLDTINQNTNEIQANYEFLCELDSKIDRLTQRLDKVQMMLSKDGNFDANMMDENEIKFSDSLTKREQEVFMVLYTNESKDLTYSDIAKRLAYKREAVRNYISSLSSKGIPIIKKFLSNKIYIYLDPSFKDLQTRKNVLNINQGIIEQFV